MAFGMFLLYHKDLIVSLDFRIRRSKVEKIVFSCRVCEKSLICRTRYLSETIRAFSALYYVRLPDFLEIKEPSTPPLHRSVSTNIYTLSPILYDFPHTYIRKDFVRTEQVPVLKGNITPPRVPLSRAAYIYIYIYIYILYS